jgi:molecular chaperone DnaK (HSP70)
MAEEYVIGLDFGNFYSQPCIITGIDPETKRGGIFRDLTDPSSNIPYGIPTAFFYAKNKNEGKPVCGVAAVKAVPPSNCYRYLKRDMFKNNEPNSVTIDGRTFTYDEMITQTAEHALRIAVSQLEKNFNTTTHKVSLAYPASISANAKIHLVARVEKARHPDGKPFCVVGTIAEPAAAALDEQAQSDSLEDRTVLVYDFGAGTFDVPIVSAYPRGRTRNDGSMYYYDVIYTDGYSDLGGAEADKVMIQMLMEMAGPDAKDPRTATLIRTSAEGIKRELTTAETYQPEIQLSSGYMDEVKRSDFEARIRPLIKKTVDMVADAMNRNSDLMIDRIVLTGGSSQMPIVRQMLEERFPAYRTRIGFHSPSKAISAGAARYGVPEPNPSFQVVGSNRTETGTGTGQNRVEPSAVVVRTIRDIGVRFYQNLRDENGYISVYVPAGTPIPFTSEYTNSSKLGASEFSRFTVYEATKSSPDVNSVARDFRVVCDIRHNHGVERPKGFRNQTRIIIDDRHLANLEVRERDNPSSIAKQYPFSVEQLLE